MDLALLRWSLLVIAMAVAVLHTALRGVCCTPWEAVRLASQVVAVVVAVLGQFVARGLQPAFPNWTLRFELLRAIIRECTETYGDRMVADAGHARVLQTQSDAFGSALGWFYCLACGRKLEAVRFNGLEHLWVRPSAPFTSDAKRVVVLYIHGGAFALLSPRFYTFFGAKLASSIEKHLAVHARDLRVEVLLGNYRKMPVYRYPTQPKDALAAYNYLLQHDELEPSQIILAGDSAGGGLVMSTLLRVRERNPAALPLAAVLICPCVDFSGHEPKAPYCILSGKLLKAMRETYHPTFQDPTTWSDASAVHCNLRGLPPVFLQSATLDYLYQHSVRLAVKAQEDGVDNWELDVHEDVPHVFSVFPQLVLPYGHVGLEKIAAFMAKQSLVKRTAAGSKE